MSTPLPPGQGSDQPDQPRGEHRQEDEAAPAGPSPGAQPDPTAEHPQPDPTAEHPRSDPTVEGRQPSAFPPPPPEPAPPEQGTTDPGHTPPPGYPAPQPYPAPSTYPPQGGYPPPAGYPSNQGYPPTQGYPQQGYPTHLDYPSYPGGADAAPPGDPLVPPDFAGWFQRIMGVVRRSWLQLLILQLIGTVVSVLIGVAEALVSTGLYRSGPGLAPAASGAMAGSGLVIALGVIGLAVSAAVGAFLGSAGTFLVIRDAAGHPTGALDALRLGASRALPLLGWLVVAGLMIGIPFALARIPVIGLVFFLVVLYLTVVFGASLLGVVVVERRGLGRCFTLVNRRFWPTLGRMATAGLIGIVYVALAMVIAFLVGAGVSSIAPPFVAAVLLLPIGVLVPAVSAVTYAELRFHESGWTTTASLAAEMSR